jgi:hypothetical protein
MWVEKFKSPTVTRTKSVGRTVTRTKRGCTKHQGGLNVKAPNFSHAREINTCGTFFPRSIALVKI